MATSLMMVTYNRLDLTKRTLTSLIKNTNSPYRLIIVDNGSSDSTAEYLKQLRQEILDSKAEDNVSYCKGFDYQLNKNNMGIAVGRNQALKIAGKYKDRWLATLDNDIELPPRWLNDCIDFLKANEKFSIGVNMEDVSYPIVVRSGKECQLKAAGNLGSACMVFNQNLHDAIGFFTTEYEKYGEEDADWGFRARRAGFELGYIKNIGNHFGVGELDQGEYRKFKDECRSKNINKFRKNCMEYAQGKKSIYIPFNLTGING